MANQCSYVTTIPQFTGTCWFNALLMALLYSDNTRLFFHTNLKKIKTSSKTRRKLISMFINILTRHYHRVHRSTMEVFSAELKPEHILKRLHNSDAQTFYFDPNANEGHTAKLYLIQIMKYFKMGDRILYCKSRTVSRNNLYVTLDNFDRHILMDNQFNAGYRTVYRNERLYTRAVREIVRGINYDHIDVLYVSLSDRRNRNIDNIECVQDGLIYTGKLSESIKLGGHTYVVDSLMLSSMHPDADCNIPGHSIAGVTCNGQRYIYNGWIRDTRDNAMKTSKQNRDSPCTLMAFDWFNNKSDFCLNTRRCNLTTITKQKLPNKLRKVVCFNVRDSGGVYVYVKSRTNVSFTYC